MCQEAFVAGLAFGHSPHGNREDDYRCTRWRHLSRSEKTGQVPGLKTIAVTLALTLGAVLAGAGLLSAAESDERKASQAETEKDPVSLEQEVDRLQAAVSKAQADRKDAEARLAEAERLQQRQQKTILALNERAAAAAAEEAALHMKMGRLERRIVWLITRLETAERDRDESNQQYGLEQKKAERLESAVKNTLADRAKRDQQLQFERKKAELLEAEMAELEISLGLAGKAATDEVAAERAKIRAKNTELQNATGVNKRLTDETNALREQLASKQKQLASMKVQIAEALAEVRTTRSQIAQRVEMLMAVATAAPAVEFTDLQQELVQAKEEIARLRSSLNDQTSSSELQPATQ